MARADGPVYCTRAFVTDFEVLFHDRGDSKCADEFSW